MKVLAAGLEISTLTQDYRINLSMFLLPGFMYVYVCFKKKKEKKIFGPFPILG